MLNQDEQSIRQLVSDWLAASKAGDTEKVLSLMTEDVVFLLPGRPPMQGKAAYAAAAAMMPPGLVMEGHSEIREIEISGDLAYLWSRLTVIITPPGAAALTRAGHTLTVFRRVDGRWLLARDANLLTVAG